LTYFEFGTLAALWLMVEAGVQDWVLEVGLGGRLDAVNIVDPTLAIITSVDLDHVDWLGTDRDQIGFEKAGIFRPDIPALYGESDPPKSVLQQAQAQRVRLWCQGIDYGHCSQGNILRRLDGGTVELPVLPDAALPVTSLYTAAQAMVLLGFAPADVVAWLPTVAAQGLAGRYEQIAMAPDVRVDVGHNPHAARWLAQRLTSARAMLDADAKVYVVYAALADKDVEGVMAAMAPVVDQWLLAGLNVPRGLSVDALAARATSLTRRTLHPTVEDALDAALASARPTDLVVVFGSFHTVAQAREHLEVGKRPVASAHSDDVFSGEGL
ncbi:MAG: bifunctional tetrahydrofolate synthase/dihydrofolate synthase, partial [Gammaproteobacteria bacterium]|nr:bifunctional tetrahydrofolate synthase/dihydrofolate synthase [Gammaproteobacteria bacterium]